MNNLLSNMFGGQQMNPMIQRFQQFQQMFKGDPGQQIQQLMNSGRISQGQYNQAVQMAQQFKNMMGGMFGRK